jgi:hypothetical protein
LVPPPLLLLQIRLTNGTLLCAVLPPDATLADVLDYVDAHRSDSRCAVRVNASHVGSPADAHCILQPSLVVAPVAQSRRTMSPPPRPCHPLSGRYQLREAMPGGRAFFSGDLGATLVELRLPDAPQPALELEAVASKPKRLPAPVPGAPGLALQFKLTNDDVLRGSFAPDSTLAEVRHWLDMNRTGGYAGVRVCGRQIRGMHLASVDAVIVVMVVAASRAVALTLRSGWGSARKELHHGMPHYAGRPSRSAAALAHPLSSSLPRPSPQTAARPTCWSAPALSASLAQSTRHQR